MSSTITEVKLKALCHGLYQVKCEQHGKPLRPLKQIIVGNIGCDGLTFTTQLFGNSYIAFTDEFLGSMHTALLLDTIKHELAHILAGVEHKHDKEWQRWAKRFGAKLI